MAATEAVIIDNSLDGAAAGAAFLLNSPGALVFVSSAYSLPSRVANIREWNSEISSVSVCGVGCRQPPEVLAEAFEKVKGEGISSTWFLVGNGFPEHESVVKKCCKIRKAMGDSLTRGMIELLHLKDHPRARLLELIASKGRTEKITDPEAKTLAQLAVASMYRFFQLGDREAYPDAVRKMAGLRDVSGEDLSLIKRFETLGYLSGPDGSSRQIKELRRQVKLYAPLDTLNVLILGETGSGKEIVARLIHQESKRAKEHFVAVNCAALSGAELLDSKLFGHEKGAFTGAYAAHQGILEVADKGTLFLDEIGEMPHETQAKLLRVMEDGSFSRMGSNEELKVDVRIIAATNRNLADMVRTGGFRIDLYYRLRELVIRTPPLRERFCDLGQIVGTIRRELSSIHNRRFPDLTEEQFELLRSYSWPGNVRQLKSLLQRAFLLGVNEHLGKAVMEERAEGLDLCINKPCPSDPGDGPYLGRRSYDSFELREACESTPTLREVQVRYAVEAIDRYRGNLTATAKALGISVNTLKKLRSEAGS